VELYFHFLNTPTWSGDQLKHRDNFTCTFISSLKLWAIIPLFRSCVIWPILIWYSERIPSLPGALPFFFNFTITFFSSSIVTDWCSLTYDKIRMMHVPYLKFHENSAAGFKTYIKVGIIS
jgi:hypothetical protein